MSLLFCTNLTSDTIPNSVTSIGYVPFAACRGLTSITIGSRVASIGQEAFVECHGGVAGDPKQASSVRSTTACAWARRYGLPTDGRMDYSDTDGDGHNSWQPNDGAGCGVGLTQERMKEKQWKCGGDHALRRK